MIRLDHALRQGLQRMMRSTHWIVLLYLVSLVLGLLQSWPLLTAGLAGLSNPLAERLALGDLDAAVDLFLTRLNTLTFVGVWAMVAILLVPMYGLVYNFWSGGIVSIAASPRSFWPGARHTFWSFTALGLLILSLMGLAIAIGVLFNGLLGWGSLIVVAVLVVLVNTLGEFARAAAVAIDRRNPFVLLGQAIRFCVRHILGVLVLSGVGWLLTVSVFAVYIWAAERVGGGLFLVVLQQGVAFLVVWIKAARLMWAATYMQGELHRQS